MRVKSNDYTIRECKDGVYNQAEVERRAVVECLRACMRSWKQSSPFDRLCVLSHFAVSSSLFFFARVGVVVHPNLYGTQ